ncbi:MAG TPA: Asp-tRNA(Asn)/Glu-tRNA(Gln) amidotransferase subunit GatA [Chthoniobacterales bacterium]|nr:Asp-tRNA(Asn)/Glu-tRNA(Gln) amidotransferase subunit GatA [Chthoniobacterales bacterium]
MTPADIPGLAIVELQKLLRAREVSPREVLEALQARIENLESKIGAYLSHDLEAALAAAETADVELPLGGIPIAIKDAISVKGQPCTCASRILGDYRAIFDATVIRRLKAAGAIPFGKTNMDEFAMGSSSENSSVKPTRNPWDEERIPGGSSGGSAAAVAAGMALASLGSDTGGSIRQPAALCGVVGLKPTYGRVSRYGLVAFASSLDQIGPITKTVEDAALLLGMMAGLDPNDSTSLDAPVPDYRAALEKDLRGVRLGLPKEYLSDGIDHEVRSAVEAAAAQFSSLGAEIIEVSLPHTEFAIDTYYIIATAEASANLARFDGVRYGYRAENPQNLADQYNRTRAEGFGPEVKRRIILGTYVLSSGYYDAYYLRAQKVRTLIRQDFARAFEKVDALISPTTPEPAFKLGERSADPLRMYLADIFTNAANLAGICGLSIPCGFARSETPHPLPVGLQIMGRALDEARILQVAHAFEQSTDWRRQPL